MEEEEELHRRAECLAYNYYKDIFVGVAKSVFATKCKQPSSAMHHKFNIAVVQCYTWNVRNDIFTGIHTSTYFKAPFCERPVFQSTSVNGYVKKYQ